jgi:hypothetical protein
VAFVVLILGVATRLSYCLQLRNRGLTLLTSEQEFQIYFSEDSPYNNYNNSGSESQVTFQNIGLGAPGFEAEYGKNFSLLCFGPRIANSRLIWTSDAFLFHKRVRSLELTWPVRSACLVYIWICSCLIKICCLDLCFHEPASIGLGICPY